MKSDAVATFLIREEDLLGLAVVRKSRVGSTEKRSMSCVALDGRALATYSCYMQSMLFY